MIDTRFSLRTTPAILKPCISELMKAKTAVPWTLRQVWLLPDKDSRKKDVIGGRFDLQNIDDPAYPRCGLYWKINGTWYVESVARKTGQTSRTADLRAGEHLVGISFPNAQKALEAVDACLIDPLVLMAKSLDKPGRKERKMTRKNPGIDISKTKVGSDLEESPALSTWTNQVREALKELASVNCHLDWKVLSGNYATNHEIDIMLMCGSSLIFITKENRWWWRVNASGANDILADKKKQFQMLSRTRFRSPAALMDALEDLLLDPLVLLAKHGRKPLKKVKKNPRIDTTQAKDLTSGSDVIALWPQIANVKGCVSWKVEKCLNIPDVTKPVAFVFRISRGERKGTSSYQWFSLVYFIKAKSWQVEEVSAVFKDDREDKLRSKRFKTVQQAVDAAEKLLIDPLEYLAYRGRR